jgi:hypothetical protein
MITPSYSLNIIEKLEKTNLQYFMLDDIYISYRPKILYKK